MKALAIDTETTGLFIHKGSAPFLIITCDDEGELRNWEFEVDPFTREVQFCSDHMVDFEEYISEFDTHIFHNASFDIRALESVGIPRDYWTNFHDTMLMSHSFRSDNKHGLKDLGVLYLNYLDTDETELEEAVKHCRRDKWVKSKVAYADPNNPHPSLLGTQKEWFRADYWLPQVYAKHHRLPETHPYWNVCLKYGYGDVERTMGLYLLFQEAMDEDQWRTYLDERNTILPLLNIQTRGARIIPSALKSTRSQLVTTSSNLTLSLQESSGLKGGFNPKSHPQLRTVLFDVHKFKSVKEGKSGPSTDKEVLSTLLETQTNGRPSKRKSFLEDLMQLRKVNTTIQYLDNYNNHKDRFYRLHTSIRQLLNTGRMASSDPNIMNIGKNKEDIYDEQKTLSLRNVFGPQRGRQWFCIDYDQFQLRIFAYVSDSKDLLDGFAAGRLDAHNAVAQRLFRTEKPTEQQRKAAKYINFGLLFGAGPDKIEKLAGVAGLYDTFMSTFPSARKYLASQARKAKRYGYVHTVDGYRLHVPSNQSYAASCYVIQGTEARIFKKAIRKVDTYFSKRKKLDAGIVMPVHDELVIEAPNNKSFNPHLKRVMKLMTSCGTELGIPSLVDAKRTSTNWADAKEYNP